MKEKGEDGSKASSPLGVTKLLERAYGFGKTIFSRGDDDWVVMDADDLTEDRLREFIKGTPGLPNLHR